MKSEESRQYTPHKEVEISFSPDKNGNLMEARQIHNPNRTCAPRGASTPSQETTRGSTKVPQLDLPFKRKTFIYANQMQCRPIARSLQCEKRSRCSDHEPAIPDISPTLERKLSTCPAHIIVHGKSLEARNIETGCGAQCCICKKCEVKRFSPTDLGRNHEFSSSSRRHPPSAESNTTQRIASGQVFCFENLNACREVKLCKGEGRSMLTRKPTQDVEQSIDSKKISMTLSPPTNECKQSCVSDSSNIAAASKNALVVPSVNGKFDRDINGGENERDEVGAKLYDEIQNNIDVEALGDSEENIFETCEPYDPHAVSTAEKSPEVIVSQNQRTKSVVKLSHRRVGCVDSFHVAKIPIEVSSSPAKLASIEGVGNSGCSLERGGGSTESENTLLERNNLEAHASCTIEQKQRFKYIHGNSTDTKRGRIRESDITHSAKSGGTTQRKSEKHNMLKSRNFVPVGRSDLKDSPHAALNIGLSPNKHGPVESKHALECGLVEKGMLAAFSLNLRKDDLEMEGDKNENALTMGSDNSDTLTDVELSNGATIAGQLLRSSIVNISCMSRIPTVFDADSVIGVRGIEARVVPFHSTLCGRTSSEAKNISSRVENADEVEDIGVVGDDVEPAFQDNLRVVKTNSMEFNYQSDKIIRSIEHTGRRSDKVHIVETANSGRSLNPTPVRVAKVDRQCESSHVVEQQQLELVKIEPDSGEPKVKLSEQKRGLPSKRKSRRISDKLISGTESIEGPKKILRKCSRDIINGSRAKSEDMSPTLEKLNFESASSVRKSVRKLSNAQTADAGMDPEPKFEKGGTGLFLESLSHTEDDVMRQVMSSKNNAVLVKLESAGIALLGTDIKRLYMGRWLNDQLINAYMHLINERNQRLRAEGAAPRTYVFNSFFYTRLTSAQGGYDYEGVRRWTARAKIDVLEYDLLLVPVNLGSHHWILAGIDIHHSKILYLDSMHRSDHTGVTDVLRRWVHDEITNKHSAGVAAQREIDKWNVLVNYYNLWRTGVLPPSLEARKTRKIGRVMRMPRQGDESSCGVFSAKTADCLSLGVSVYFRQRDILLVRKRMILDLLKQSLPP